MHVNFQFVSRDVPVHSRTLHYRSECCALQAMFALLDRFVLRICICTRLDVQFFRRYFLYSREPSGHVVCTYSLCMLNILYCLGTLCMNLECLSSPMKFSIHYKCYIPLFSVGRQVCVIGFRPRLFAYPALLLSLVGFDCWTYT